MQAANTQKTIRESFDMISPPNDSGMQWRGGCEAADMTVRGVVCGPGSAARFSFYQF